MTLEESVILLELLLDRVLECLIMIYSVAIIYKVVKMFTTF